MNSAWIVIFVSCTVNPYEVTVHAQEKKKKKSENMKLKTCYRIQLNRNGHLEGSTWDWLIQYLLPYRIKATVIF